MAHWISPVPALAAWPDKPIKIVVGLGIATSPISAAAFTGFVKAQVVRWRRP